MTMSYEVTCTTTGHRPTDQQQETRQMTHFHSIIADDRRDATAADLLRSYRHLRAEGFGRADARAITNALRISTTFADTRPMTIDGIQHGAGRGLRGRARLL